MELAITQQETLQIDELFSSLENIIMKIILVGADTLEKSDLEEMKTFIDKIEELNLKYLTEKTKELYNLVKKPKKIWSRLEREQLALITSLLHQTIITIKSKFVRHNDFSRKEKSDLQRPVNVKQDTRLELMPLGIEGIGRTTYGSGKYYGRLYKLIGINLETNEFITVIDHSMLQASSMNSKWYSSLANETLYLNKLLGNKLTIFNLVSEGSTVFRKAPKNKKKGEIKEITAEDRREILEKFKEANPIVDISVKNIRKFIYDPKADTPFKVQFEDEENTTGIISFSKNLFYYMYFNDKKNAQILKYGNTTLLFDKGDAFLTDLPLSLPVTIWDWNKIVPLWLKNKEEYLSIINMIQADILKGKAKNQADDKLEDFKISKAAVRKDMLKFFVMNELNEVRTTSILPTLDWKALLKEQCNLEYLTSSKNWDPQLAAILIFASKKKKLLKTLDKKKHRVWQHDYIEKLLDKQDSKGFSTFVLQRIKSNAPPKEIVLLLILHLMAFDFLTEDIIKVLKSSQVLERSKKLDFYMDSNVEKRFWLSCIPLFTQIKRVEIWERVMLKWVMDSLSPTENRHLAFANVVSQRIQKKLLNKSRSTEIASRDSLAIFVQQQLMKIGVNYIQEPQIDWSKEIEPFKDVKTSKTSITDTLASLMIYKNGSEELASKYEDKKKIYWGFLLIKELLTRRKEDEVNRLVSRLVSSSPKNSAYLWALMKDAFNNIPKDILRTLRQSQSYNLARKMDTYLNFKGNDRFYYSCLAVIDEKEMKKL
ncbi:MAG: hypothetical protein ACTSQF_05335 [Candidatus Heimdallarchaeaceae archaeon]